MRSTSRTSRPTASDARSPQAYMSSSRARSRRAAGSVPARRGQQAPDLVAREHLGQALALARRAQVRRRVVVDDLLAAQVAVEGAQARRLALQGGGGHRRPVGGARGEVLQERGEVGVHRLLDVVTPRRPQEGAELEQVRAIGLQRVARQRPLELQVGEEVQHVVAERADGDEDGHCGALRPRRPGSLAAPGAATRRARALRQPVGGERPARGGATLVPYSRWAVAIVVAAAARIDVPGAKPNCASTIARSAFAGPTAPRKAQSEADQISPSAWTSPSRSRG